MLILTIAQLDITLESFSFYHIYTSACNLVSVFVRLISVKIIVCVFEDGVKLNYSRLILSQRKPCIDYAKNKEKHTREI